MKRVLFICKLRGMHGQSGTPYGLYNSARFVAETMVKYGYEAKVVDVIDGNSVDREVAQYKPTHVMLEAIWVTPEKIKELLRLHKNVQWVIRIHSKAPFLAMEGVAIEWLNQYRDLTLEFKNFQISANNKDFTRELHDVLKLDALYLPNIYAPECKSTIKKSNSHNIINIGCFGSVRPLKNQFLQAIAAIGFANKIGKTLKFHINASRVEQRGETVLKNLRALFAGGPHKLIEHEWLPHDDFIKLVRTMDLGMQVSLTESFNIVTADFVAQNVPIIVSDDIDWVFALYQTNPNSSKSMIFKLWLARLLSRLNFQIINRVFLWWYNLKATIAWFNYLSCI